MMGRITTRHLVTHGALIVREYGWRVYWKAWRISLRGGTFLEAVCC